MTNKKWQEPTLEQKYNTLQNLFTEQNTILNAIEAILQDKDPTDFELSYEIVRQVYDLKSMADDYYYKYKWCDESDEITDKE